MAGIKDLARECGVSVATVSRALNGHPEVSVETRRQVQQAAERLGYRPSQSARALVRGRSDAVGLLWDSGYETAGRKHPFLLSLLVGLKQALSDVGRHLILLNVDVDRQGPRAYLDTARQFQVDGVIVMGVDDHRPALRELFESSLPCVAIDHDIAGPRACCVTSDNRAGAVEAVRHLHDLGHRRIATITGPVDLMPAVQRLRGFQQAVGELGLDLPDEYVQNGDFFMDSGYACGRRLAGLPKSRRPTAVFVAGDEMALGAMHAFADAGLDVPEDIAVVGFDDIEAASLVRPALTTVAQDSLALGTAAVSALLDFVDDRFGDRPAPESPILTPTRLVIRQSCGGGR
ncbi:LacI family DNA-binding transcriptional regulator [Actinospica sp. MGRD01-02]|uniref:LacI family DNA-binding transcriptional regulator n=1 Tax=Actinospica acidithermotolerans TaxID=2828514 RepID=A0A941ECR6_9ACTN|nr:LacI family DNA-binding transcriptional regulator [Actinospica acidithermotolerans]MBR7828902.1 LacI family DNA-binding transcriptional regulator [Actinospica acidithermotolerans]